MSVEVKRSELNPKVNVVELSGRLDVEAAEADTLVETGPPPLGSVRPVAGRVTWPGC